METIGDIINELIKVQNALDDIEVKGRQNAALLCFAYERCTAIANALTDAAKNVQNESTLVEPEDGEENGQQDREPA